MTDVWKRRVPLISGVAFVGLLVAALVMGSTPGSGSSGAKIISFYTTHHGRSNAAVLLLGYGAVMAVIFYANVAGFLRSRGSDLLATLTIAGGVIVAVALLLAAGTTAALTDKTSTLSAGAAQALNQMNEDLFFVALFAGLMLATTSIGIAILRTKALPKALGIVTLVVGVVAVSGIGAWFAFLATGPLALVLAGYIYQRQGQPASITMPDVPDARQPADATVQTEAKAGTA
jgi:hypothetical protein